MFWRLLFTNGKTGRQAKCIRIDSHIDILALTIQEKCIRIDSHIDILALNNEKMLKVRFVR